MILIQDNGPVQGHWKEKCKIRARFISFLLKKLEVLTAIDYDLRICHKGSVV